MFEASAVVGGSGSIRLLSRLFVFNILILVVVAGVFSSLELVEARLLAVGGLENEFATEEVRK